MTELWQLFDEQGQPLADKGAPKAEVFKKGLLHAASHVWIWRRGAVEPEVLVQKRAAGKVTWPNRFDISAAGHIDLGEAPLTAALREIQEEIGLTVKASDLYLISVHRAHLRTEDGSTENEFQFLYLLELSQETAFTRQDGEVASLQWQPLSTLEHAAEGDERYVPHRERYYRTIIDAVKRAAV